MLRRYLFVIPVFFKVAINSLVAVDLPTIDLQDFYNPEKREEVISVVKGALHELGFFAVKNTGIDSTLIEETFEVAKEFFALDDEIKMKIDGAATGYQRGLIPYGREKSKGAKIGDHKEYLHIGREFTAEQRERLFVWDNIWPEEFDLHSGLLPYMQYLEKYMVQVQHILALCLDQEETFFDELTREGDCLLRVIHNLAPNLKKDERMVWTTPHTDIDLFTILPQATADGLEAQLSDGSWVPVKAEEGSFIVNAGDFFEAFSNGYYKSAPHRVMSPEGNIDGDRYSMVYFVHIRANDAVYPLPYWVARTGGKQKYANATRLELLFERLCDLGQSTPEMMEMMRDNLLIERLMQFDRASVDAMERMKEYGFASDAILEKLEELEASAI